MPRSWRRLALAAFALGAGVVLGVHWREDRYSCHLCRARMEVQTRSFFFWPAMRRSTFSDPGQAGVGHGHDWWRYSYQYSNGCGGCLGSGVGCKPSQYRDESTGP